MARGVNKVILVGNLGADPDVKYTQSQMAVVSVNLATTDAWKDRNSGQKQERTEWHRLVFFNRLAEIAGEYLRKGSQVYVEGRLQTRKWQGKDGQDRYTTEIVVNDMQMLGGRGGGSRNNASSADNFDQTPQYNTPNQAAGQPQQSTSGSAATDNPFNQQAAPANNDGGFEDDIPF